MKTLNFLSPLKRLVINIQKAWYNFVPQGTEKKYIFKYFLHLTRTVWRSDDRLMKGILLFCCGIMLNSIASIAIGKYSLLTCFNLVIYFVYFFLVQLFFTKKWEAFTNFKNACLYVQNNPHLKMRFVTYKMFKKYIKENKNKYCVLYKETDDAKSPYQYLIGKKTSAYKYRHQGRDSLLKEYDHTMIELFRQLFIIDDEFWVFGWDAQLATHYIASEITTPVENIFQAIEEIGDSFLTENGKLIVIDNE